MSCNLNIGEIIGFATLLVAVATLIYTFISSRKSDTLSKNQIKLTNDLLYKQTEAELSRVRAEYENLKIRVNIEADSEQDKCFNLGVKEMYVDRYKVQYRNYEDRIDQLTKELDELKSRRK